MRTDNFFSELKRRNVYKVAVAYVVVAWLLIQAASILFPTFDAPASAMKILVVILAIGFPIALGFSWAFEITPEGIKRESEVSPNESIRTHTGRKLVVLTTALAVIATGLLAWQLLRHRVHPPLEGGALATPTAQGLAGAGLPIPEKSIAVLPFENLSDEKQNAYFAAGIQDEILTRLAKIGALKVISRSSTQQYQSKPGNLRLIAQELGVANILEGSVQKAGTAVHVNVQLIKAATDDHLWAESYDRTLENIFGVEGEIAQTVAEALKAKLTGAEEKVLAQKPTTNPAAYQAYLRGTSEYSQTSDEAQKAAILSLEEAVRLDPQFAVAWAALSQSNSRAFFGNNDMTAARRAAAEKALHEAIRLQPDLAETQLARAYFQYWVVRDYAGALQMMQQLRVTWPNNSDVLQAMELISARLGHWSEALDYGERAVTLNPKELYPRIVLIQIGLAMRELAKTSAFIDDALHIWPNNNTLIGYKIFAFQARGQLDEAQSVLRNVSFNTGESDTVTLALFYQAWVRRDPSMALKSFDALGQHAGGNDPSFLLIWAALQNQAGKAAEARTLSTRACEILEGQLREQPQNDSIIGPLIFGSAALGQREKTLKLLERYDTNAAGDARSIGIGYDVRARAMVRLGDKEGAIANLEKLLAAPSDSILGPPLTPALLAIDPDFDSLRGDPRFDKLCQEPAK